MAEPVNAKTMPEDTTRLLDKHIGNKIKERRRELDLTQGELAKILTLSHQQIQRYETGENAPSMARLIEMANILNVKPSYFYENAPLTRKAPTESDTISRDLDRPLRLLLVEDKSTDELLFRKAAAKCPITTAIHAIQHAEKVMDYLRRHVHKGDVERPDLIILDINMPRLNGLDLLKLLKETPDTKLLPVIMLTNSIRSKDMQEAYRLGATGFIQKNSDLNGFYEDINRILQYWGQTVVLAA